MGEDFIREYWEGQAAKFGASHEASWGDHFMIDLEIETIGSRIPDGATVLDIGCGNGFSTFRQLETHRLRSITGVDFAAGMIGEALRTKAERVPDGPISFETGDVQSLRFADGAFDVVYTTRVLINLPTWDEQQRAIDECLRVARPGGTVILSEAFWEPLQLLNALRALRQLAPLVEHDFNRYLKKQRLEEYLSGRGLSFEVDDFSSIYYLGSRFLRELVTDPSRYPGFTNPVNELFYSIERRFSGGGFGIQQACSIRK
jgi:ubiquinone/menaquinone biosynthesis C-methylase UbiE